MCSNCENTTGKSLSYNSYGCYPCSTGDKIALLALMILGCIVIVAIVVAFLKLNLHISTAGFYSFLYFYSVLPLFFWLSLPRSLEAILTIVIDFTSLDFDMLKYLKLCFFDNVRPIHYEFLHFVYPILVILIIFALIKLDKHCFRRCSIFRGDSSIQALCIILLISYTSISETALKILLPLFYEKAHASDTTKIDWYVYADPGVKYFDYQHHLPFWIVAVLVELFLLLPFALGMLFAPWLMQCFNLARIYPILDEYQACFKDRFRWFPGVYLTARQVLMFITLFINTPDTVAYLQQIFCLVLVILVATLQPYQETWINCMDTLFLSLLCLISYSAHNSPSQKVFTNMPGLHTAVIAILTLTPVCLMFFAICSKLCWSVYQRYTKFKMARQVLNVNTNLYYDHQDLLSTDCSPSVAKQHSNAFISSESLDNPPPRFYEQEREACTGREESSEDTHDDESTGEDTGLLDPKGRTGSHSVWRRMVPTGSRSSDPKHKSATRPASGPTFPHTRRTD